MALEFGVHSGKSINFFSSGCRNLQFYGLDSFEGLQEDWAGSNLAAGAFDLNGELPKVKANVTLVKGWFEETLPNLMKDTIGSREVPFVHVDSDTYEAAATVFEHIGSHLRPGTLVLFDELLGYPNWRNGEYKAFNEAVETFGFTFQYLAFAKKQALVEIL